MIRVSGVGELLSFLVYQPVCSRSDFRFYQIGAFSIRGQLGCLDVSGCALNFPQYPVSYIQWSVDKFFVIQEFGFLLECLCLQASCDASFF